MYFVFYIVDGWSVEKLTGSIYSLCTLPSTFSIDSRSWVAPGTYLGSLGLLLGSVLAVLGGFGPLQGPLWAVWGRSGVALGPPWAVWDGSGDAPGPQGAGAQFCYRFWPPSPPTEI